MVIYWNRRVLHLLRFVMEADRHRPEGKPPRPTRRVLSILGIFFLSVLALTTGTRRPYLNRVNPASYTSKASLMTVVHPEVAPRVQVAESLAHAADSRSA